MAYSECQQSLEQKHRIPIKGTLRHLFFCYIHKNRMENTFWGSKIKYSQLYRCFVRWFGTVCFIVKIPWSNREIARSLGHKWLPSKIPSIWDWLRPLPQNKFYRLFFFRIFVKGVKNITLIQILVAQMFSKILAENSGRFLRENIDPCVLGGNDIVKKISFSLKSPAAYTNYSNWSIYTGRSEK